MNLSALSQVLLLTLAASPLEHMHWEGSLTDIPIGRVEGGGSREVEIPLFFVSEGVFSFVGEARMLGESTSTRSGEGELEVHVMEDE